MRSQQVDGGETLQKPWPSEADHGFDVDVAEEASPPDEEVPSEPRPDADGETLLRLGLMYAIGRAVPVDLVTAHKWLNLAAMRGNQEAQRLRLEIASDMSPAEIAAAQRAARDWLARTERRTAAIFS